MNRSHPYPFTILLAVAAAAACGDVGPRDVGPRIADDQAGITNGSPATRPYHEAVVGLIIEAGPGDTRLCSGTLITPRHVLTAAHCIDRFSFPFPVPVSGSSITAFVGNDLSTARQYRALTASLHPSWDPASFTTDLAIVRLRSSVPSVTPIPSLPSSLGLTPADFGAPIDLVGFGLTSASGGTAGTKLQFDTQIAAFGCPLAGCPPLGSVATAFSYSLANGGTCFGDSGGPAVLFRGSQPYVAGVTSFGDSNCSQAGGSARVAPFESWIRSQTGSGSGGSSSSACSASRYDAATQRSLTITCQDQGFGGTCTCSVDGSIVGTCSTGDARNECSSFPGCCAAFF